MEDLLIYAVVLYLQALYHVGEKPLLLPHPGVLFLICPVLPAEALLHVGRYEEAAYDIVDYRKGDYGDGVLQDGPYDSPYGVSNLLEAEAFLVEYITSRHGYFCCLLLRLNGWPSTS